MDKKTEILVRVYGEESESDLEIEDEFYATLSSATRVLAAVRDLWLTDEDVMDVVADKGLGKRLYEVVDRAEEMVDAFAALGLCCHRGSRGCYCQVGWPYDKQCINCRDSWSEGAFRDSYCICPPTCTIEDAADEPGEILLPLGMQMEARVRDILAAHAQALKDKEGK